jgi:hypothetical protein
MDYADFFRFAMETTLFLVPEMMLFSFRSPALSG